MAKQKRKLTRAEKAAKARRKAEFEIIFVHGKQKRVRRREIDGMTVEDFIRANADPIWLHQNEMWEYMEPEPPDDRAEPIPSAV
jgi:hypothetical protein